MQTPTKRISTPPPLISLQALRFIAAGMVVYVHALATYADKIAPVPGSISQQYRWNHPIEAGGGEMTIELTSENAELEPVF